MTSQHKTNKPVHPLVKELFTMIEQGGWVYDELELKSGYSDTAIYNAKVGRQQCTVDLLVDLAETIGKKVIIVDKT